MSFWVAKSRQKAPENAFTKRARLKAEAEEAKAAQRAAAAVSGSEPASEVVPEPDFESLRLAALNMVEEVRQSEDNRGRPKSSAVEERTAKILALITESGSEGVLKAALVEATGENAANVNAALQRLKGEGKVSSQPVEGSKAHRWFAV